MCLQVYGSRGKALVEKVMRNSERCDGSSVLANARSWGVKILYVDDFLAYIEKVSMESSQTKNRKLEKKPAAPSTSRVMKAGALKQPFVKIEDSSRRYRPLHQQFASFPDLDFSRISRFSPFEPPAPQPPGKEEDRVKEKSLGLPTSDGKQKPGDLMAPPLAVPPVRAKKKNQGFCECCQQAFKEEDEHLQSEQHRHFVQSSSHYSVVDRLISEMSPAFVESPLPDSRLMRSASPPAGPAEISLELVQNNSEVEKAIEALLSRHSPERPAKSPVAIQDRSPDHCPGIAGQPTQLGQTGGSPPTNDCIAALATPCTVEPSLQEGDSECLLPSQPVDGDLLKQMGQPTVEEQAGSDSRVSGLSKPEPLDPQKDALPVISPPPKIRKRYRSVSTSPRAKKRRRTILDLRSDPTFGCTSASDQLYSKPLDTCLAQPVMKAAPGPQLQDPVSGLQEMALCSVVAETVPLAELCNHSGVPAKSSLLEQGHFVHLFSPAESQPLVDQSQSPLEVQSPELAIPTAPQEDAATDISPCFGPFPPVVIKEACLPPFLAPLGTSLTQPAFLDPGLTMMGILEAGVPNTNRQEGVSRGSSPFLAPLCPADLSSCCLSKTDEAVVSTAPHSQCFPSVGIDDSLLPTASFSSESDWDCGLLSRLEAPPAPCGQSNLDLDVLRRTCARVQDSGYESRLCSVLRPSPEQEWAAAGATSRCSNQTEPLPFRALEPCLEAGPV
ncbi:DBF4B protein, partial [Amia calva]|nr:DBF4B protein [Amia calva]